LISGSVERAKGLQEHLRPFTLLHDKRGKPLAYRTIKDTRDAACKAAKVENAHIHDIRARALTDAQRNGHDSPKLAGHADRAMTERYIRLRETAAVQGPTRVKAG